MKDIGSRPRLVVSTDGSRVVGQVRTSSRWTRVAHRPGSDFGQDSVNQPGSSSVDEFIAYVQKVYDAAVAYGKGNANEPPLQFMRWDKYTDSRWGSLFGDVDNAFIQLTVARGLGRAREQAYTDPSMGVTISPDHLIASAAGYFLKGSAGVGKANRAELASWGGDLLTFYGEWSRSDSASPLDFCRETLARPDVASTFSLSDLIEDIDGFTVATKLKVGSMNIVTELRKILLGGGHMTFQRLQSGQVRQHHRRRQEDGEGVSRGPDRRHSAVNDACTADPEELSVPQGALERVRLRDGRVLPGIRRSSAASHRPASDPLKLSGK